MKILKIIFFPFTILFWVLKIFFWLFKTGHKKEKRRLQKNARRRAATLTRQGKGDSARAEKTRFGIK